MVDASFIKESEAICLGEYFNRASLTAFLCFFQLLRKLKPPVSAAFELEGFLQVFGCSKKGDQPQQASQSESGWHTSQVQCPTPCSSRATQQKSALQNLQRRF
uniref:Uncharacterized protein n=1 Tax=Arundo donax TaxID=35708 RepID=A0A0A9FJZ5_ARUDO